MYLIFSDAHDGQWLNFQLTVILCIVNRFTRLLVLSNLVHFRPVLPLFLLLPINYSKILYSSLLTTETSKRGQ